MVEQRSRKVSTLIFLFAIFIVLIVFTAGWIYRMYITQTALSESQTLLTIECGRYYFNIKPGSVLYENNTLYFEIENNIGAVINSIVVESVTEKKQVDLGGLEQGLTQPVSLDMEVIEWVMVYPEGCKGANFKNLSFEPRTS